jgi:glycosyltransferase involved in cell wall biosynthesis
MRHHTYALPINSKKIIGKAFRELNNPLPRILLVLRTNNRCKAYTPDFINLWLARQLRQFGFECVTAGVANLLVPVADSIRDSLLLHYLMAAELALAPRQVRMLELRKIARVARQFRPDLILTSYEEPSLKNVAIEIDAKLIHWSVDMPSLPEHEGFASRCDYVFTAIPGLVPVYTKLGVPSSTLLLSVDSDFYLPGKDGRVYDIVFTGSFSALRERKFQRCLYPLIEKFGKRVHIFGKGWNRVLVAHKASLHGHLDWRLLPEVYRRSSIVLNYHDERVARYGGLNLRTFESFASRCCLISDYVADMERHLVLGQELIVVTRNEGWIDAVEEMLSNNAKRERIARSGMEAFTERHSIRHRAHQAAAILTKL